MDEHYCRYKTTEDWNGEGFPPVGTVCECAPSGIWMDCEVAGYYSERQVWVRWIEADHFMSYPVDEIQFRPIRTPEQIAAVERAEAIDGLVYAIVSHYGAPKMAEHYLGLATYLHNIGYRKTE